MDISDNELNTLTNIEEEETVYEFQPLETISRILSSRQRARTVYQPVYPSWLTTNIVRPIVEQWNAPPLTIPGTPISNSDIYNIPSPPSSSFSSTFPSITTSTFPSITTSTFPSITTSTFPPTISSSFPPTTSSSLLPSISLPSTIPLPILSAATNIINRSLNDENKYKEVISEKGLKCIKTIIFDAAVHNDITSCVITREKFKQGEEISQLPCGHIFKKDPIEIWLKEGGPTCPVCRHKFDSKEIKKEVPSYLDNSQNIIEGSGINQSMHSIRNMLINMIDERIEEEEEYNIQRAILESLREDQNNTENLITLPSTPAAAPLPPPPPPAPLPPLPPSDAEETISDDEASNDSETY